MKPSADCQPAAMRWRHQWAPRRAVACLLIAFGATAVACDDTSTEPGGATSCSSPRMLARGQVQQVTGGAALECMVIGSATDASEYMLITANAASVQDEVQAYRVTGEAGTGVLASRSARVTSSAALSPASAVSLTEGTLELSARAEASRHAQTRQRMMGRDFSALAAAGRQRFAGAPARLATAGDTLTYRVGDAQAANMCTTFSTVRAVVRAVGTRAIVAQDVAAPANGFSAADFAALAREYDAVVHPTAAQWFGETTDINGDGRVVLLFTPAINRLTPPGSLGFVGGYFWSADLLPRAVPSQGYTCPASNEQEIMYLLTPDPDGQVNGNRFTVPSVYKAMRGTIAHELQHLINQGVRQGRNAPPETDWMNEGLSHLAEELVGRAVRGFPVSKALTFNDVLTDLDDYDAFFRQNLIRFRAWMARPDLASPISSKAVSELAPRGASWALLRYALDQYGGTTPSTFTRALVTGPQVDVANLEARSRVSFTELLPGYLIAATGDTAAVTTRYRFTSWALRDAMSGLNGGVFPLRTTVMPADVATQTRSGSGTFYTLSRPPASPAFTFRMRTESGAPVSFNGARAYLVRLR